MRRTVGYVLVGLGVFFLLLAPLARWYVLPRVAVAPLGCTDTSAICKDRVNLSPSEGIAASLFDPGTLKSNTNVPLVALERVIADIPASKGGSDNLTVYNESQTVNVKGGVLADATTMRIPFNGNTSQMINCCNANTTGTPITDFTGINPLKFGFFIEQKDYLYFDKTIGKATPAKFKDVVTIDGVETYQFVQTIEPTQTGEVEVPGNLVGSTDPSVKAPRFYSNIRTLWVEPVTGVIVKGSELQKQTLRGADGTDKLTLIEAELHFTADNVRESAKAAKDGASKLGLIKTTIPLIGLVLGLICLAIGLFLVLGARRDDDRPSRAHAATPEPQPQA